MLNIKNITKTFNAGTVNAKTAIKDLSLNVNKGDFITIIGANGGGKSTLFNAIAGSFYTDSGTILLDGKDITLMPEFKRARTIGRLFQDPMRGSAPGMSIEENLYEVIEYIVDGNLAVFGNASFCAALTILLKSSPISANR